ncbi:precorrin-6y C5,15-methyltransferase (decarboxylating) subunit CbiE [Synechococcus sp. PCC 7336]|uniref:precorrin-6y C5,15-methyltransferase (decarboxylating) subunit CbiE n=1 Tax=Synechococcus sp. PCC 7336 TaxID=195250 RepID=UPI000367A1AC|nr:precorrin-6y C5,15-methyltransferase (decarboxylating) subunit CbiE [Synechococcus sp. PCC 7336]
MPTNFRHQLSVVGMGLDGMEGLSDSARSLLHSSSVIAGPPVHLQQVRHCPGRKLELNPPLRSWIPLLQEELQQQDVVLLATGDPFFFGIGRLLAHHFPPSQLTFYPQLNCVQLACNRLHIPWQSVTVQSVHGRSLESLQAALKQSQSPIAVLTDPQHSPAAIAQFVLDLRLPVRYDLWVCSHLGGDSEQIEHCQLEGAIEREFPVPNIVILQQPPSPPLQLDRLPLVGIADRHFLTFPDRPGLIAKQEVRSLSLSLLQLPQRGVVWDVGAGTGSVSVEIARLGAGLSVFAIERDAAGIELIRANAQRFALGTVAAIAGTAPEVLQQLPLPDRVFVGGGGKRIVEILRVCVERLRSGGMIVANFATLENCLAAQTYLQSMGWRVQLLQVNLARSVAIASATRFSPLNPVTLLQAQRRSESQN